MSAGRGADWLAIVNPASGGTRTSEKWAACEGALRSRGVIVEAVETTVAHDGERIARRAVGEGWRRLIVGGGDGSVHDVVNGIMDAGLRADDRVTIAQAPLGTGNDWAHGLGLPRSAEGVADLISSARSRPHDVGQLEFVQPAPGGVSRRWFVNVAGAGFDAAVIERLQGRKRSKAAYLAGALRGLFAYESADFSITFPDTGQSLHQPLLVVFIAIGAYCGGGMCVAPTSSSDDGLLDVVAVRDPGLIGTLRRLRRLYDGSLLEDSVVTHARAARVRIEATAAGAVQADGQIVGRTPCEARIVRQAIDVIAPGPWTRTGL